MQKIENWTIDKFGYGPLNPDAPDPGFWEKKADLWNSDIDTSKKLLGVGIVQHLIK